MEVVTVNGLDFCLTVIPCGKCRAQLTLDFAAQFVCVNIWAANEKGRTNME